MNYCLRADRISMNNLDPKCDWAIRHLGQFPVEVQNASYDMLLRIPGVGPKSAQTNCADKKICDILILIY